jgi:hypothetical protein
MSVGRASWKVGCDVLPAPLNAQKLSGIETDADAGVDLKTFTF